MSNSPLQLSHSAVADLEFGAPSRSLSMSAIANQIQAWKYFDQAPAFKKVLCLELPANGRGGWRCPWVGLGSVPSTESICPPCQPALPASAILSTSAKRSETRMFPKDDQHINLHDQHLYMINSSYPENDQCVIINSPKDDLFLCTFWTKKVSHLWIVEIFGIK